MFSWDYALLAPRFVQFPFAALPPIGENKANILRHAHLLRNPASDRIGSRTEDSFCTWFADSSDLERELSILASDIPGGYMLSFRPSLNQPGLHIIKVQTKKNNNLNVAARSSYWSQGKATEK
jgi:hypothetical protein